MSVFSNKISRFISVLTLLFLVGFSTVTKASENASEGESFNASEVILHHVMDDHIWHFWDGHYGTLHLPIIVYSAERGLDVFSSSNFYDEHHNVVEFNGYKLDHNHIYLADVGRGGFSRSSCNLANCFTLEAATTDGDTSADLGATSVNNSYWLC